MESTFEKIMRKTGKKPIECKCQLCKSQCQQPCKGTPEDIAKLISKGYANRLQANVSKTILFVTPLYDKEKRACTFFSNGLCELHDLGLKPTEGRLSHHSTTAENFNMKKSLTWHILKEWDGITVEQLKTLLNQGEKDERIATQQKINQWTTLCYQIKNLES